MRDMMGTKIEGEEGTKMFNQQIQKRINEMKEYPEQFFNFGFTYEDFQSYLMKLMYCRSVRRFIERKRMQRIEEYYKNGLPMLGFGAEDK